MAVPVIGVFAGDMLEKAMYERAFSRLRGKVDGYVFTTPEAGFDFSVKKRLDIVFLDIHFWGESFGGFQILNTLKRTSPNVIAIGLLSLIQEGDIERIIGAGFSMCIEKPISAEALEMFCGQANHN